MGGLKMSPEMYQAAQNPTCTKQTPIMHQMAELEKRIAMLTESIQELGRRIEPVLDMRTQPKGCGNSAVPAPPAGGSNLHSKLLSMSANVGNAQMIVNALIQAVEL